MNQDINYSRWQEEKIRCALKTRRVLLLVGSRQCGKTTLAKSLLDNNHTIYYNLDERVLLESAKNDPESFVKHGDDLMIIDEIQRVPELLLSIKKNVDENQNYGRFLLTGSANVMALPTVVESLAGRVSKIRLRPLSIGEVKGSKPSFIRDVLSGNIKKFRNENSQLAKDDYLKIALKGGYPEILRFTEMQDVRSWHLDYLSALIDHDLNMIAQIKRKDELIKLIEILAAWSSKLLDVSSIGRNLSLVRSTIQSYIITLENFFLIERVRPWSKTDYDRIGKQEKIFMTDTGLMASLLKWNLDKVRQDSDLNGKLIETFVFTQIASILDMDNDSSLYHYRDREKREIDFIIESGNNVLLALEVKAGSVVSKQDFKHIMWFKNNIAKGAKVIGVVLYTGEHILPFGEDMWVVPISTLWCSS